MNNEGRISLPKRSLSSFSDKRTFLTRSDDKASPDESSSTTVISYDSMTTSQDSMKDRYGDSQESRYKYDNNEEEEFIYSDEEDVIIHSEDEDIVETRVNHIMSYT